MNDQNNFCTIYVVRHGESLANASGIVAGHTDADLTEKGKEQAEARAQEFKDIEFDFVFSSDLIRARKTAEIVKLNRELAVNTKEILRERNFGSLEGSPIDEYIQKTQEAIKKLQHLADNEKMNFKPYEDYESNTEIASRMLTFLRETAVAFAGKTILVASHGSIMRATLMHLGFGNFDELPSSSVENLGYFKLRTNGVEFYIEETKGINKIIK